MFLDDRVRQLAERTPTGVEPEFWAALPLVMRVQVLVRGHYLVELSAEDHDLLRSLPPWLAVSPEDGYPEEWFNTEGWLLPKYQPGGGCYPEFLHARHEERFWQRAAEGHQVWFHQVSQRWGCLGIGLVVSASYLALLSFSFHLHGVLREPWRDMTPAWASLIAAPVIILLRYRLATLAHFLSWACVRRRHRRRIAGWSQWATSRLER